MADLTRLLNFLATFIRGVCSIIEANFVLRIAVGLPIFAVILYTVLMVSKKNK